MLAVVASEEIMLPEGRKGTLVSKKPPPHTGSRSSAEGAAQHKSQADATTGAGGR